MSRYKYSRYMICIHCNWPWLPKSKVRCERCGTFFSWGKTQKDSSKAWVRKGDQWRTVGITGPSRWMYVQAFSVIFIVPISALYLLYYSLKTIADVLVQIIS